MRITDENTEDDSHLEATARLDSGNEYLSIDQYEQAIQDFDEAIRLNPQDAHAYYSRGRAYVRLGQYEQGIQDYNDSIPLNPQDAHA